MEYSAPPPISSKLQRIFVFPLAYFCTSLRPCVASKAYQKDFVRGISKFPKLNLIAPRGFENNLGAFAEAFVAQIWPKENSSKFGGFQLGIVGFRNFCDFADFGGISTLCQTPWEGTRVSSAVL